MATTPKPMDAKTLAHVTMYLVQARRAEAARFSEIYEYFHNRVIDIYIPKRATDEFKKLVDQSRWNILPTLESALANKLAVDGYRPDKTDKNAKVWDEAWQPNRMDARQAGLWHNALRYGMAYNLVLPGRLMDKKAPVITPRSPRKLTAMYDDPINDEWPRYVLDVGTPYPVFTASGMTMVTPIAVYDFWHRYRFNLPATALDVPVFGQMSAVPVFEGITLDTNDVDVSEHAMGVCPAVRYLESFSDLDDGPVGILYPMLPAQRGLNQTTFNAKMAEQYAVFLQKVVTGMAIDEDDEGNPINPFNVAVDQILIAESPETRFDTLDATPIDGYLTSRDKQLLYITASRHLPPHTMVVGSTISNVNAEALAMLQSEHGQDVSIHQTALGEGVEQTMRLCGKAMGDEAAWNDVSAQTRWRDTTPRSLAQIADALGKLAQMLGVPARGLWERIPGVTDQDLELWDKLAKENDAFGKLEGLMNNALPGSQPANPQAPSANGGSRPGRNPARTPVSA